MHSYVPHFTGNADPQLTYFASNIGIQDAPTTFLVQNLSNPDAKSNDSALPEKELSFYLNQLR